MLNALVLMLGIWNVATASAAAAPISRDDPESSDFGRRPISTAAGTAVVVTANPLASEAALSVLQEEGTAVDALVAAQAVLAVVEPQSSGLGGGSFLLHWNAEQRSLSVLDGREVAHPPQRDEGHVGDGDDEHQQGGVHDVHVSVHHQHRRRGDAPVEE